MLNKINGFYEFKRTKQLLKVKKFNEGDVLVTDILEGEGRLEGTLGKIEVQFKYKGDIYIAISTSGSSKNIIKSIEEAKKMGLTVIGLTGVKKSKMDKLCDCVIKTPSEKTSIIQESHIMVGHVLSALIESKLF